MNEVSMAEKVRRVRTAEGWRPRSLFSLLSTKESLITRWFSWKTLCRGANFEVADLSQTAWHTRRCGWEGAMHLRITLQYDVFCRSTTLLLYFCFPVDESFGIFFRNRRLCFTHYSRSEHLRHGKIA